MLTSRLETPDVNLYYTVRGSRTDAADPCKGAPATPDGSDALFLPGLPIASPSSPTTVADFRGASRSPKEGYEIAAHAADAARLITALSSRPVFRLRRQPRER